MQKANIKISFFPAAIIVNDQPIAISLILSTIFAGALIMTVPQLTPLITTGNN